MRIRSATLLIFYALLNVESSTKKLCFQLQVFCNGGPPAYPYNTTQFATLEVQTNIAWDAVENCSTYCSDHWPCHSFGIVKTTQSFVCGFYYGNITRFTYVKNYAYYKKSYIQNGCISAQQNDNMMTSDQPTSTEQTMSSDSPTSTAKIMTSDSPTLTAKIMTSDSPTSAAKIMASDSPTSTAKIMTSDSTTSTAKIMTSDSPASGAKQNQPNVAEPPCKCNFPPNNGWQVFQRRCNGWVNFYRNYANYSAGFGNETKEFWKGNDWLASITNSANYKLRIDLEDFNGTYVWAEYTQFKVDPANNGYRISFDTYTGTAGDSLSYHDQMNFYTFDHDTSGSCAYVTQGAWWYNTCHYSNLNGKYLGGPTTAYATGVIWRTFRENYYSLKCTEMKIMLAP